MAELQTGVTRGSDSLQEFTELLDVTASKEIIPVNREIALRGGEIARRAAKPWETDRIR